MNDNKLVLWVEKWPNWLRWALFIPITVAIAVVFSIAISKVYQFFFSYSDGFTKLTSSAIFSLCIVIIPYYLVPQKGKLAATIVLGCVWGVVHALAIIFLIYLLFTFPDNFRLWDLISSALSIVIIVGIIVMRTREHFENKKSVTPL